METIHILVPIGQVLETKQVSYSIPSSIRPMSRKMVLQFYDSDQLNSLDSDFTGFNQNDLNNKPKAFMSRSLEKTKRKQKTEKQEAYYDDFPENNEVVQSLRKHRRSSARKVTDKGLSKSSSKSPDIPETIETSSFINEIDTLDESYVENEQVESLRLMRRSARASSAKKRRPKNMLSSATTINNQNNQTPEKK